MLSHLLDVWSWSYSWWSRRFIVPPSTQASFKSPALLGLILPEFPCSPSRLQEAGWSPPPMETVQTWPRNMIFVSDVERRAWSRGNWSWGYIDIQPCQRWSWRWCLLMMDIYHREWFSWWQTFWLSDNSIVRSQWIPIHKKRFIWNRKQ